MTLPLRIGMIGAGMVSAKHMPAYRDHPAAVVLAAVCDTNLAAAQKRADQARISTVFDDPLRMIRQASIDAVDICTSHDHHAELAIAAAQAGKHVLMEKPLGCTPQQCQAVLDAASASGVTLMVGMNHRFDPRYRAIVQAIVAGELGRLHGLTATATLNLSQAPADHWVFDGRRAGGGVIMSLGVQLIDLARYLAGEIKQVVATVGTTDDRFHDGAESQVEMTIDFQNGARGRINAQYVFETPAPRPVLLLEGQHGSISIPPGSGDPPLAPLMTLNSVQGNGSPVLRHLAANYAGLAGNDTFANQILHFAHCCQIGQPTLSGGAEAIKTMTAIFAIYQSTRCS